jgi:hypothetical protein
MGCSYAPPKEGVSEPATAKPRDIDTTPSFFLWQEMRRELIRLVAMAHLSRSVLRFVWHDDIGLREHRRKFNDDICRAKIGVEIV